MSGNIKGRRNWTLSMTFALLVAAAAAVIGFMNSDRSAATDRYYLNSSAGNILFDHGKHGETADSCATCHHTLYGAQAGSCEECHDEMDAADFEHAELKEFHERDCATCHEQTIDDDQADSCRNCHPALQDSETGVVGCSECHGEGYEPDLLDHDEYLEIDDHSCSGCHTPGAVAEVYHSSCTDCHLEEAADRFTLGDGGVNCSGCHLR